ncbi:hypothetical protein MMC34_004448 [Xylographa carneopallida]|nr:hypothetical protein [Xylographa carneopallida]
MSQKCAHKGCGKKFTDPEEPCTYHPGPPIFHEGQKGWKCCKPRVLTFDEFLTIPPCTTGKHSIEEELPVDATVSSNQDETPVQGPKPVAAPTGESSAPRVPQATPQSVPEQALPEPESEEDDPSLPIPPNTTCRRRGCGVSSLSSTLSSREGEQCIFHPGHPIFHEGSKGWTCCKRRVLEFDEFLRIEGCEKREQHKFVGSGKKGKEAHGGGEERVENVKHDFYQTPTTVHASLYLKKISKANATISFSSPTTVELDLPTSDNRRYKSLVPLYAPIDPEKSAWKIMGTKMELTLVKADGQSWPVLRADERRTGEIIQVGKAGRA